MSCNRALVLVVIAQMAVAACDGGDERVRFGTYADAGDTDEAGGRLSSSSAARGSGDAAPRASGTPHGISGAFGPDAAPVVDGSVADAALDASGPSADAARAADAASLVDAAAACTTRAVWYADEDHDGFGDRDEAVVGCREPASGAWVTNPDDCDDDDVRVHPGETTYFGDPYVARDGDDSFDYDCSGSEDVDPSLALAPGDCALLAIGSCGGSGYLPTGRTGVGKSPFCGSMETLTCSSTLVLCAPTKATTEKAFGCR